MIRFVYTLIFLLGAVLPAQAQIDIEKVETPGGLTVWLVNEPSIPFISLNFAVRGGTSLDPVGKEGATNLMMGLLEEGTGDLDAAAFKRATDGLAAYFGYDSDRDFVRVSADVLKSNAPEALALLKRAITAPSFDDAALERVRRQVLSGLESDQTDPDYLAGRAMNELAYGGHAYGRPSEGTIETVTALTREDMINAHRNAIVRDRLLVSAVGDITAEELGPLLDTLFSDLPQSGPPLPPKVVFKAKGGTTIVDFDTPQSVAIWAHDGINRHDERFLAAYVMNYILGGGGFGSRLTDEVREKRGLTYGVYSYLAVMDHTEFVGGGVASANNTIAQAIEVVKSEWRRIAEEGVTAEELERAKKYLTGSYPLRFSGNAKIARILTSMQVDDLGIDYVNTRNAKVNALTLEEVSSTARDFLDADALHFVVVGKPEGLE